MNKAKSEKLKVKNIIKDILEKTREDLKMRKRTISLTGLGKLGRLGKLGKFRTAMLSSKKGIALIAEIKLASPSEEDLGSFETVLERAETYEKAGADAISVVVEKHFFKGDIAFIPKIKAVVSLPILMKDFVVDECQILEAVQAGADAILLIARIVDKETLQKLVTFAFENGIEPIVEIDNADDIQKAIGSKTRIIAVNARDLDTFEVTVERACEILKKIPNDYIKIGFSGIKSNKEVQKYKNAEARGVLVGTSLMKARNIKDFILSLRT